MNEFIEGDKLEVNKDGEIVLVSRPGWVCDDTYPEPINGTNPNVHVLFDDGREGVGFYSHSSSWYIFPKDQWNKAIENYHYTGGAMIEYDDKPIGWKTVEKNMSEKLPILKLWDRVYSEYYGYGSVAFIDNDDKFLPYTVVFDKEHAELHTAVGTLDNGPENRCYWCTTRPNDRLATIRLADTNEIAPNRKYEIGNRITSRRYGCGTIAKMDGQDSFLVVYDTAADGLWGDFELEKRCRWEEEETL